MKRMILVIASTLLFTTACKKPDEQVVEVGEDDVVTTSAEPSPLPYEDLTTYKGEEEKKAEAKLEEEERNAEIARFLATVEMTTPDSIFLDIEPRVTPYSILTNGQENLVVPYKHKANNKLQLNGLSLTVNSVKHQKKLEENEKGYGYYKFNITLENKTGRALTGSWYSLVSLRDTYGNLNAPAYEEKKKSKLYALKNNASTTTDVYFSKTSTEDTKRNLTLHTEDKAVQVRWVQNDEKSNDTSNITESWFIYDEVQNSKIKIDLKETNLYINKNKKKVQET